uniref:H15 domain-containing protein n=1 Tax=Glycine max TaxID=3847 RepID=C6THP7_SOYBN|nr:unknown [Glycine max]
MSTASQPKAKKTASSKKPLSHPPFAVMIAEAIASLKERTGSSQYAMTKYIEGKHKELPATYKKLVLVHLKKSVAAGKLVKVKNSFKLAPTKPAPVKAAAPKKPTKAATKPASKPKAATPKKKAVAKPKAKAAATTAKPKSKPAKVAAKKVAAKPAKKKTPVKAVKKPKSVVKKPKSVKSPAKKTKAKAKK